MKKHTQATLPELSTDDVARIAGGNISPIKHKPPQAEDMYGNTMSMEEWMDRQLDTTKDPHDFYDPHFNPGKPNIWR